MLELAKLAQPSSYNNMEGKYYSLIKKGFSKEEIKSKLNITDNYLRQIKSKLRRDLVSNVILKTNNGDTALAQESIAYKYFSVGRILLAKQAKQTAIELLEDAFRIAIKENITGIALECAGPLASYYGSLSGQRKKFQYYNSMTLELLKRQNSEITARGYWNEISYEYANAWHPKLAEKAFAYCAITEKMVNDSLRTAVCHFSTLYLAHISILDWEGLIAACNQSISFFSGLEHKPVALLSAYKKKTLAYMKLKQYDKAGESIDIILAETEYFKYTWCVAMYYKATIGLHTQNILLATETLAKVKPAIADLPANFQEQWKILEAYIALFEDKRFKVGRFLNEVPIFSKDKVGANTAILVVQMLHFLKAGNTNAYLDRIESLENYSIRNLPEGKKVLIKMLIEVARGHFRAVSVAPRVQKYKRKLAAQDRDLEVLPPSMVWQWVEGHLR